MDKREFMRFPVELKVEAYKQNTGGYLGVIKDFSRNGLKVVFDDFKFDLNSPLELRIRKPDSETWFSADAEVIWKRQAEDKWDVGFRIKSFSSENKAEILEYGYFKWLKENVLV